MSTELTKLSDATRMLAEIRSAWDAKRVMDMASAAKTYAQKAKLGREAVAHADSIRLQAETMLGEYIRDAPKRGPEHSTGGGSKGSRRKPLPDAPPTLADAGLTKRQSSEAQFLADLAKEKPEEHQKIINGQKTITQVRREQKRAELLKNIPALPTGKFRVLYADPPWKYGDTLSGTLDESYGGAEKHYPAMTITELCALPVKELTEENAVLFLWVTSPLLFECAPIIKAWGFDYRTSFVWDKVLHNMGHYNSVRHEFLLVCVRGSCTPEVNKLFDSVQTIERSARHSEKPEAFRKIIETLYPCGNKIELFARRISEGWETYGNEA